MNKNGVTITLVQDRGEFHVSLKANDKTYPCKLPINEMTYLQLTQSVKTELGEIVMRPDYGIENYVGEEKMSLLSYHDDLKKIAKINVLTRIFYGFGYSKKAVEFVDILKELTREPSHIKIFDPLLLPWTLIYEGDTRHLGPNDKIDPNSFWGFKHDLEIIPISNGEWEDSVPTSSEMKLSLNINRTISKRYVEEQDVLFERLKQKYPSTEIRSEDNEVFEAFKSDENNDSIIYFYCHARTVAYANLDILKSYLNLTSPEVVLTLNELHLAIDPHNPRSFKKSPLVFINACESGEPSPLLYYGFVPYFFTKGSKCIVGTLAKIPAIFASKFSIRFFDKLEHGHSISSAIRLVREEFRNNNNNLLGLYYISFGQANFTIFNRQIARTIDITELKSS